MSERLRITAAQAEAISRLLSLLRQDGTLTAHDPPLRWIKVRTELHEWHVDENGKLVGWDPSP